MRVCVYNDERVGALASDGTIIDLTDLVPEHTPADERMNALIANWEAAQPTATERVAAGGGVPEADVVLRAPQPRPRNLFAAPVNYHKHQQEMGGEAEVRELQAYLRHCCEGEIPPGPWDRWVEREPRDAINTERAQLLAQGRDEIPPAMLRALGA